MKVNWSDQKPNFILNEHENNRLNEISHKKVG